MSTQADLWWYGPRILIGAVALASISSEITTFLKEMELTKDLPSDAVMARFRTMLVTTVFFTGIQVQRITTCFTSTTFLAQLTFYIWTVECLLKTCILFGSIALLSFDKDFADKIDNDFKADAANSEPMLWFLFFGSFCVGVGLRMILNELRTRDREAERQREALLRIAKGMAPFPGFSDVVLTEEAARRQLLRVRTWPRVITALLLWPIMVDAIMILSSSREHVAGFRRHRFLESVVYAIYTCVAFYAVYRKSLRLTRGCLCTFIGLVLHGTYFRTKNLVKLYRNSNPSGTSMVTSLTDAISADDQTVQDFPFAKAVLVDIIDISCDLLLVWSMWQIVKDLEERNDRIAKARIESRAAAAAAAAAASNATIYHVYQERGQQSSAVGI
ncbi:hypothetical protein BGX30_013344 [Mortierella sp. GBA39]|nr:hypothetical protein BGX30_013344 [Mortierella sp. GBA39]